MTRVQRASVGATGYDDYLLRQRGSLVYQSSKYRQLLVELLGCEDHTLVLSEAGAIRGVLPLMCAEDGRGKVYNSLPYYGSNGGVLADDEETGQKLVATYNELALAEDTAAATVVANPFVEQSPSELTHNLEDERIAQFTELSPEDADEERILARIDGSARRNVAKARKSGMVVRIANERLGELHRLHEENMQAIGGLSKSKRFFDLLPTVFTPGEDFKLYVADKDGEFTAALLVLYFNRTAEYYTPVIDHLSRPLQPLSLILLQALADAAQNGYQIWNWGGTWPGQVGVYRFKRKWAAREEGYSYYTQLNDRSLLELPPAEILARYPSFFVVPFSALARAEAPS